MHKEKTSLRQQVIHIAPYIQRTFNTFWKETGIYLGVFTAAVARTEVLILPVLVTRPCVNTMAT